MENPESSPPDDIVLVALPPERWEEYRELRMAALRSEPTAFSEPVQRAAERSPEEWRARLDGVSNWLVFAERDGTVVGLAGAYPPPEEPGVVFVVSVFVDAAHRGRGVGRRLMTALIHRVTESADATVLRLRVNDTNAPAIALYESLGFAVVGAERDALQHAGRSYDELIMERPVRPTDGDTRP